MALIEALRSGKIDVIATDHAPHTSEEKSSSYFNAPAGLPLVQHALPALFDLVAKQELSAELVVDRACHAPADLFGVENRGYIREGYFADLVLLDTNKENHVNKENILYKCGWSPFNGYKFKGSPVATIINGKIKMRDGKIIGEPDGTPMKFK